PIRRPCQMGPAVGSAVWDVSRHERDENQEIGQTIWIGRIIEMAPGIEMMWQKIRALRSFQRERLPKRLNVSLDCANSTMGLHSHMSRSLADHVLIQVQVGHKRRRI